MIGIARSLRRIRQACLIETLEDRALFSVVNITPGNDWVSAVNSSAPGDTINFATGNYVVPTSNIGTQLPGSGRVYSGASGATFVGASGSNTPELMLNSGGEARGFTISNVEFAAAGSGDNVHDNTFVNGAFAWVEAGLSNSHFDHNTFNGCHIDGYLGNNDTVDYNFFQNSGESIHFGGASPQNTDISNNVILNASHYGMELGLNCNGLTVNNNYITLYGTDSNTAVCGISAACGANATAPYANAGENMMFSGNTIVADSAGIGCGIEIMGDYNIQINNNFITGFGPGWWPCILNGTGGQRGGGLQTNNNTFIAGSAYADGDSTPWSTPPRVSNGDKLYGLNDPNRPSTPGAPSGAGASSSGANQSAPAPVQSTPAPTKTTTDPAQSTSPSSSTATGASSDNSSNNSSANNSSNSTPSSSSPVTNSSSTSQSTTKPADKSNSTTSSSGTSAAPGSTNNSGNSKQAPDSTPVAASGAKSDSSAGTTPIAAANPPLLAASNDPKIASGVVLPSSSTTTPTPSGYVVAGRTGVVTVPGKSTPVKANAAAEANPSDAISLSAWINADNFKSVRKIVQKGAGGQYRLSTTRNGLLRFDLKGVGTLTAPVPSSDVWHLITGTFNGTTMALYVDGQLVSSSSATGQITITSGALVVGGQPVDDRTATPAKNRLVVDDVRIYSTALSASDIANLYDA